MQILCRATPNVLILREAPQISVTLWIRAIKRSVGDRTWSSFRLKWLFCNDCNPRLFNPLIRLFVATPLCGDKLLVPAAIMLLLLLIVPLTPPIDPKLVSIFSRFLLQWFIHTYALMDADPCCHRYWLIDNYTNVCSRHNNNITLRNGQEVADFVFLCTALAIIMATVNRQLHKQHSL